MREAHSELAQHLVLGLLSISQESALSKNSANLHTPTLRKKHYENTVLFVRPLIYDLWPARDVKHTALSPSLSPSWCNAGVLSSQLFPLHSASHGDVSYDRRQAARSAWGSLWLSPLSAVLLACPVHVPLTTNKQTVQHARVSCFTTADLACVLTSGL